MFFLAAETAYYTKEDNAGWHRSKKATIPLEIQIEFLPPYSPELQPAERL